jgi:20S proteasome alpha/beta subunit
MDASSLMGSSSDAPTSGEHRMGTTIVGVCYDGGVVLAADSRTSTGMLRLPPLSVRAPGAGVSSLRRC